jgi:hypothetical protein
VVIKDYPCQKAKDAQAEEDIYPPIREGARKMRGTTFQDLAFALGISSSGLRRWARRGRIPGAAYMKGRWILRGPLTTQRIDRIRSFLNLNPSIATGRKGENLPPIKEERVFFYHLRSGEQNQWDKIEREVRARISEDLKRFSELVQWEHEAPGKTEEMALLRLRLRNALSSTEKRLKELEGLEGLTDTEKERRISIFRNRIKQITKTLASS